ncbi:helix-turn-helix domain-containing protein [Natronosporangium hydrolyticum]|uniref:Helix-turn-helix domain-containing protein n=1 Tax=Natronosporangium hydrolyticum TaxID=2811111 RepID=A0A895YFT4_9ACTN|nr:helix-turn-helix transcriptional regulator [Natronosporangium hydrolyticum]QSB13050.1 helix-turn-helix domain-containing protein [Natronosporangium hydrolyticum]
MTVAYGATVAKRRLSRRLTELRGATTFTANQVCDKLGWGRGKLGRFEGNTWKRPELSDIRDLLRFYQVNDEERRELEELARRARARDWWREYGDVFGDTEFPGFEADATRVCLYMPLVLPGLLQTPAYTEAQMNVATQSPDWRKRTLEARQRRQEILDRDDGTAPRLEVVVTEASLLYQWGTREDRHALFTRLIELSQRAKVDLRLLRFQDGLHPGMCGPINIFDFPGGEPQAVFLETDFAIEEVNGLAEVGAYKEIFSRIRDAAADPATTTAELTRLREN